MKVERIVGKKISGKPGGGQTTYSIDHNGKLKCEIQPVADAPVNVKEDKTDPQKFQGIAALIPELNKTPKNTIATWADATTIMIELYPGEDKWIAEGDVPDTIEQIFNMIAVLFEN